MRFISLSLYAPILLIIVAFGLGSTGLHAQQPVWGFADLHTHPASHRAFGADVSGNNGIFWGKPALEPGLDLASSSTDTAIATDLPACGSDSHSSFDLDFVQHITHQKIIAGIDSPDGIGQLVYPHNAGGYQTFDSWPAALSLEHQQMHITAIKRAYDGGLRLMIASATDNQLLSDLWHIGFNLTSNPIPVPDSSFDFNSAVKQLTFIQNLVAANSSWMKIVTTAAEARQAINNNKLAVILSLEMDSLSTDQILRLVGAYQVRHVIPIHLANNSFGGSAVYSDLFNSNNYFLNGYFYGVSPDKCLTVQLGVPQQLTQEPLGFIELSPISDAWFATLGYSTDPKLGGQKNNMALNQNEFRKLMQAGLLLDVAHMGETAADSALTLAEQFQYPLMDSHTGLRDADDPTKCPPPNDSSGPISERSLPFSHARRIAKLGGALGFGTSGLAHAIHQEAGRDHGDPVGKWFADYMNALTIMGGKRVAIGTDANGLSPQIPFDLDWPIPTSFPITVASRSGPPSGVSTPPLAAYKLGSRTYDFRNDGIANYALLPDFFQAAIQRAPTDAVGQQVLNALYHSAEDVIEMWEKVEVATKAMQPPVPPTCASGCQSCIKANCDPALKVCEGPDGPVNKTICGMNYRGCLQSCLQSNPGPCPANTTCCGTLTPDGSCAGPQGGAGQCINPSQTCPALPQPCPNNEKCCGDVNSAGVCTGICVSSTETCSPPCANGQKCCGGTDSAGHCIGSCIATTNACTSTDVCPNGQHCCSDFSSGVCETGCISSTQGCKPLCQPGTNKCCGGVLATGACDRACIKSPPAECQ